MSYKKLRGKTLEEYKTLFIGTYCCKENPIYTFDNIQVQFFPEMFEHAFYESENKKERDKSLFSYNRAEKILWIKETLEDPTALFKQGWLRNERKYTNTRRVAVVKNDYVVIIRFYGNNKAKFVTAFEACNSIGVILKAPDWKGLK